MMISIIVAMDLNGVIGNKGRIPWHLPSDLKRFKRLSLGKPCIMGRKTFESLKKPLDGRLNIVLSRQPSYRPKGGFQAHNVKLALTLAKLTDTDEVMIIGGAEVYRQFLPMAHRIYLSEVLGRFEGDAKFPVKAIAGGDWIARDVEHVLEDEKNRYSHRFSVLERA